MTAHAPSVHILVDRPLPGSRNMEIDQSLLLAAEHDAGRLTFVRFYAWETATVSIGYHQEAGRAADLAYCTRQAVPIVRRPTGGRAVFHDAELTYAVISNDPRLFPLHQLNLTYLAIAESLRIGLGRLGIHAQLASGVRETGGSFRAAAKMPCFASASRHELLVGARKIAGSAQRRLKRSFLQHGSIPLHIDPCVMGAALGVSHQVIQESTISVSEAARREVSFAELAEALASAFSLEG